MQISAELDASELEAVLARVPQIEEIADRRIRAAMEQMMAYLLQLAVATTHRKDLVNSGAYVGSLKTQIRGTTLGMRGTLAPGVPYGDPVERGRDPGRFPPRGPIELWVRRKLGISDDDEVRSVGFLVARAISRHGTIKRFGYDGGRVLEETMEKGEGRVMGMWESTVREIVRDAEAYLSRGA